MDNNTTNNLLPSYEDNDNYIIINGERLDTSNLPSYESICSSSNLPEKPSYIIHHLKGDETLVGLSLRYKVQVDKIRKFNHMHSDNLACYQRLKIPTKDTSLEERPTQEYLIKKHEEKQIKRFQLITKNTNFEEASFYLENNQFFLEKALEQYFADLKWEQNNTKERKVPFSFKF